MQHDASMAAHVNALEVTRAQIIIPEALLVKALCALMPVLSNSGSTLCAGITETSLYKRDSNNQHRKHIVGYLSFGPIEYNTIFCDPSIQHAQEGLAQPRARGVKAT